MNEGRPSGRIEEDGARRGRVLLDYLHQRDPCSLPPRPCAERSELHRERRRRHPRALGCFLDLLNAIACIGTAVTLFPVVKRQQEAVALGFVTARVFEAAIIVIGVVSLLAVVTLRQDLGGGAGTDDGALVAIGQALVAIRDWTFTLGPSLIPGVNALLLGYLMYRSGLVPRLIPALGLIGAPLLIASATATLFRGNDPVTVLAAIATVPIFIWELSLGIYLVVKGFKPSPILQLTR
jgi:hypothetical protein